MEIKTIIIQNKKSKKQSNRNEMSNHKEKSNEQHGKIVFSLDGFIEVNYKLLLHLHGAWIKYYDIINKNYYSGGFLISCDFLTSVPTIDLRVPSKSEIFQIEVINKKFFIKKDNPNYISLQELVCCKCKEKIN